MYIRTYVVKAHFSYVLYSGAFNSIVVNFYIMGNLTGGELGIMYAFVVDCYQQNFWCL